MAREETVAGEKTERRPTGLCSRSLVSLHWRMERGFRWARTRVLVLQRVVHLAVLSGASWTFSDGPFGPPYAVV